MGGRRYVSAAAQRTREIKFIVSEPYDPVEEVVVVMDNLNTHRFSSGYETFTAEEAFGIAQKLEIHYTPKYGSWLNIAAIELSVMTSQYLERRIDTLEKLKSELAAWHQERNGNQKTVKWQFTTKDARIKLHGLYPSI